MTICVCGLWHLGCVTAACLAEQFQTIGVDPSAEIVTDLNAGKAPIFEPGLDQAVQAGLAKGSLRFTTRVEDAVRPADIVWVTFDTPVDDEDRANVEYVAKQVASLFPYLADGATVLISSQLPVGSTRRLEREFRKESGGRNVHFAYSPENLRLGKALDVFRNPGRIVIGARHEARGQLGGLLTALCDNLIWMSVESAEMTKHALNAFLANSISFSNEMAAICEEVGADAKDVERGLKSDERIGPRAYVSPGGPFAGGTLARDIAFLTSIADALKLPTPLLHSVKASNDLHKHWPRRMLLSALGNLAGTRIAVLGLTYKPGTNTLRRSAAIELCEWLLQQGCSVVAFDPAVRELPGSLRGSIALASSPLDAVAGCDAAVLATAWPEFREIRPEALLDRMKLPVILDANRFLEKSLAGSPPLRYITVGAPKEIA